MAEKTYSRGAVKQHPDTQLTAVRTGRAADDGLAWFVGDVDNGGHWATSEQVDGLGLVDVPGTPVAEAGDKK